MEPKLPSSYMEMRRSHPELMRAYEALGEACAQAGPLDRRTASLVKLAVSMAAGLEGAARSHSRKALEAGCTREELEHASLLLTPTVGFPAMMRARKWVLEVVEERETAG